MFLRALFGGERRAIHKQTVSEKDLLSGVFGSTRANSGVIVNADSMMSFGPIWQGVSLLGGDVGKTPCITYLKAGRGRRRADTHPVHRLCRRWAGETTANLFWSAMVSHAALYGNAYARIFRDQAMRPVTLEFVHSDLVTPIKQSKTKLYQVKDISGEQLRVSLTDMFHLAGTVLDCLGGLSLIHYARNTIGQQLAAYHYSDDFFANNGVPHGFFTHPSTMGPDAKRNFINSIKRRHHGPGHQFKTAILEEGIEFSPTGISPKDALLVDLLNIGPKQAAHFLNLPPHKVGDDSRSSYNSLEMEQSSYLESSLGVWFSKIESEGNEKLFLESEKDTHYIEFLADARLRSDTKTRYESYSLGIQWGILSPNECRERENLNPYEGGDEISVHFSDGSQSQDDKETDTSSDGDEPDDDERQIRVSIARRDLVYDRMRSMATRLLNSGNRAAKKPEKFGAFVNSLRESHEVPIEEAMRPVCNLVCATSGDDPDEMLSELVDEIISTASDMFLAASECYADELSGRVARVADQLVPKMADIATDLIGG